MFSTIIGQPYAVKVLENALRSGRLAGAYLFVGPDGVGKATTARQFAKLLCGAASDDDKIARTIDAGTNPDVRSVEPMGTSRVVRISQLWPRDGIKECPPQNAMLRDLSYEPIAGLKRVFLINGAEGLNAESGNSILKNLEEPPPYAHFILTAPSTASVLPTIVSRCQVVSFGLLPLPEIESVLTSRCGVGAAQARFLAAYSEGRLGRAVALARSPELLAGRDALLDIGRELATAPPIQSLKLAEEFRKAAGKLKNVGEEESDSEEKTGRQPLLRGLDILATYLRDILAMELLGPERAVLVNVDRQAELVTLQRKRTADAWEQAVSLVSAVRYAVERNANAALATDTLFAFLTLPKAKPHQAASV